MSGPARLTPLESVFVQLEGVRTPMHMASIGLFEGEALRDTEGELRLADLRALISSRLSLVPKLRQRPQPGVLPEAPLVWTDDPHFDVANHVVQQRLGPPGTESDLLALCGQILAAPLNQNQPLWELRFVDGLENGRVAVIEKLHHSMADGIAAAELAMVLLNLSPEPEPDPVDDTSVWRATEPRPALFGATSDVLRLAEIPLRCLGWGAWTALHPFRRSRTLITKATAMASVVRGGLIAPHSLLNGGIGPERAFHVLRLSLNEVREVAHAHGTTVNDVVLTVVSQGLHRLMAKDGTLDQGAEVQALVPVSLSADPAGRDLGNRVSALFVRLPVGRDDPLSALGTVASLSKDHKKQHQEIGGGRHVAPARTCAAVRLRPFGEMAAAPAFFQRDRHERPWSTRPPLHAGCPNDRGISRRSSGGKSEHRGGCPLIPRPNQFGHPVRSWRLPRCRPVLRGSAGGL